MDFVWLGVAGILGLITFGLIRVCERRDGRP